MRALVLAVSMSLAVVSLAACPGPTFIVQQYGGPARPRETIATLRVNGDEPVRLLYLDQEDVAAPIVSDGRLHIEILPGRHTLTARGGDDPRGPSGSVAFVADPGKVYRVVFVGDQPRMFEVGRESDKPERDVTLGETAPAPPPVQSPPPAAPPPAPAPAPVPDDDAGLDASPL